MPNYKLCPARQKRDFLSPIFITGRSRPQILGRRDLLLANDFIGFSNRYGVRESLFLYSKTRETHQRQPTLGLWPARSRPEKVHESIRSQQTGISNADLCVHCQTLRT